MTLDPLDAMAELLDFSLQGPPLLELPSRARGGEPPVDDDGEGDDALRTVDAGNEIHRRLTEMLGGTAPGPATQSPALQSALDRARARAGQLPMTTGHVLGGMLADPDSQVSRALAELGLDSRRMNAAMDAVNLAETSDASPGPLEGTPTPAWRLRLRRHR